MHEQELQNNRLMRLERDLGRTTETERTTYLSLRDSGDDHLAAVETLRGERQMAALVKGGAK